MEWRPIKKTEWRPVATKASSTAQREEDKKGLLPRWEIFMKEGGTSEGVQQQYGR